MDLQFFGGSGAGSGRRKGGGGTPSGITYEEFMKMSEDERYDTIAQIINNSDITVPNYLDKSDTTKVIYALGMNNKPTVVSEAEFDKLEGKVIPFGEYEDIVIYRGVKPAYVDDKFLSGKEIVEQLMNGDYTQLSDTGGSMQGRALYFTTSFGQAGDYSLHKNDNGAIIKAKIKPNAKIVNSRELMMEMFKNHSFNSKVPIKDEDDDISLYCIAKGISGWIAPGFPYAMIIDRSALNISSTVKNIKTSEQFTVYMWDDAQSI